MNRLLVRLRVPFAAALIFGCLCGPPPAAARQTISGTLLGTVIDEKGTPLEAVLVRITNLANGFEYATRTNADGFYRIELLPPAFYRIDARKEGYEPGGIERFLAEVNTAKEIKPPPIQLVSAGSAPGAAPAPGARLQANTVDAALRGNATEETITSLPLYGIRSFDSFALLVPGVAPPPETKGARGPGIGPGVGTAGEFSVNGQRARANNFTVDGSDNNDQDVGVRRQGFTPTIPQPVESIVEFEVTTLLSDAEAGRNTGGQVNVVSRSGGNRAHGQAYAFFTDASLNARDFFDLSGPLGAAGENPEENPYRRYQAGGAIGAPIVRDRLHVFGAFERQHVRRSQEVHFATPTIGERQRALKGAGPFRSLVFFDLFQPAVFPDPNTPGGPYGANTYTELIPTTGDGVLAAAKVDYQADLFGKPSTLTARYNVADDETIVATVDDAINSTIEATIRTQNLAFALNTILSDSASNQVRLSYGRTALDFLEVEGSPFVFEAAGGQERGTGPAGRILFAPYSPLGVDPLTFPQRRVNNTFQVADTFVLTRGGNTLKLGGDVRRVHLNSALERSYRAQIAFTPGLTLDERELRVDVASSLDLAARGVASDIFQALAVTPDSTLGLRFTEVAAFAHDTFRPHPRVTLGLGVRYEINTVPVDATGRLERALGLGPDDFGADREDSAERTFLDAFDAQAEFTAGRERIYDPDDNNVAPRAGIAWDLTGDGRVALRAGYGLYYDTILGTVVNQSRNVFPNFVQLSYGAGVLHPTLLQANPALIERGGVRIITPGTPNTLNPAAGTLPEILGGLFFTQGFGLSFTLPEKGLRTPYVQQYALSVEAALFDRYLASVGYAGSSGRKLIRSRTPNGGQFTPIFVGRGTSTPQLERPIPELGAFTLIESSANASYNALQASLVRRFADGLACRLAYTWSHAIDDVSDVFDVAGAFVLAQDEIGRDGGLRLERGDANFDVRHRFTAGWQYEVPLLGGLELSGIVTLQSGQPFTVNSSVDANLDGNLTDRPDSLVGLTVSDEGRVRIRVAPGVRLADLLALGGSGSVGRNAFRATGVATADVALARRFEIGGHAVTARVEVFNLFNRPHFGIPVRILESPGFGGSTYTTVPARTVQVAARYSF